MQPGAHQAKREAAPSLGDSRQLQPLAREGACCPVIAANGKQDLQDCIHVIKHTVPISQSNLTSIIHATFHVLIHQHCMLFCRHAHLHND